MKDDQNVKVFCFRYLWKFKDNLTLNFKIVSDTEKGLKEFECALLAQENLERVCREYLHEYDVARIAKYEELFGGENV